MTYFKFGDIDYSNKVSELKVKYIPQYQSAQNVKYDTTIDYINTKREISVSFIPMSVAEADSIIKFITNNSNGAFLKTISILEPSKSAIEELKVVPSDLEMNYYTINELNQSYQAFTISFKEL